MSDYMESDFSGDLAGTDSLGEVNLPQTDILPDSASGLPDLGTDDASWLADGNGEAMLGYSDPLAHASEFVPPVFMPDDSGVMPMSEMPGGAPVASGQVFSYGIADDGGLVPTGDLPGMGNGILADGADLGQVIAMGEVAGAQHLPGQGFSGSEAVRAQFLHEHGYSEVPHGYRIHYIVPLEYGGADDPRNMILLTEEQCKEADNAHRLYYGR